MAAIITNVMWQQRNTEFYLCEARKQISQSDITQSLIMAIEELAREIKRIQDEIHRIRHNTRRRFD